eukprot:Selendium_serpulae@DN5336_c0_g1_i3.p1
MILLDSDSEDGSNRGAKRRAASDRAEEEEEEEGVAHPQCEEVESSESCFSGDGQEVVVSLDSSQGCCDGRENANPLEHFATAVTSENSKRQKPVHFSTTTPIKIVSSPHLTSSCSSSCSSSSCASSSSSSDAVAKPGASSSVRSSGRDAKRQRHGKPKPNYREVVRDREARAGMDGFDCSQCRNFYEALGADMPDGTATQKHHGCHNQSKLAHEELKPQNENETKPRGRGRGASNSRLMVEALKQGSTRHRFHREPCFTPPGFWDLGMPPTPMTGEPGVPTPKKGGNKVGSLDGSIDSNDS